MSGAQGTAVITRKGQGWEEGLHPDRKGLSLKKKKKKNLLPPPSFQLLNVVGGGEAMPLGLPLLAPPQISNQGCLHLN